MFRNNNTLPGIFQPKKSANAMKSDQKVSTKENFTENQLSVVRALAKSNIPFTNQNITKIIEMDSIPHDILTAVINSLVQCKLDTQIAFDLIINSGHENIPDIMEIVNELHLRDILTLGSLFQLTCCQNILTVKHIFKNPFFPDGDLYKNFRELCFNSYCAVEIYNQMKELDKPITDEFFLTIVKNAREENAALTPPYNPFLGLYRIF